MEARKIHSTRGIVQTKNLLLFIVLVGLVSCGSPVKTKKNTENMVVTTEKNTELLARIIDLNGSVVNLSEQIILVTNTEISSQRVLIQTFEKNGNQWISKFPDIPGSIGGNGFSPLQKKREGDKTSPTGIFELGPVFGYAEQLATQMEYRQATHKDFWIDDPRSDNYNKWVTMETPPSVSHEKMKRNDDLYKLGIVIQYNTHEVVKGNGSAIFVHIERNPGAPTAGCIALPEADLSRIIMWLQPEKKPLIIMGTIVELETLKME